MREITSGYDKVLTENYETETFLSELVNAVAQHTDFTHMAEELHFAACFQRIFLLNIFLCQIEEILN